MFSKDVAVALVNRWSYGRRSHNDRICRFSVEPIDARMEAIVVWRYHFLKGNNGKGYRYRAGAFIKPAGYFDARILPVIAGRLASITIGG